MIIRILFLSLSFFYGNAFADFQAILKKSKQGNAESQYTLGTLYELGEGVTEEDKEAFKGFSLAPTTWCYFYKAVSHSHQKNTSSDLAGVGFASTVYSSTMNELHAKHSA